jgi:O-ureido-D-serine cyclo-ligase
MLALISVAAARPLDEDLPPLTAALGARGIAHEVVDWDDPAVDWRRYDAAVLRSNWDYIDRYAEFSAWIERIAPLTRLLNPPEVVRWNTHKGYLVELAARGIPIVPTTLVRPGDALPDIGPGEWVVKPAIGAGSRDARRFRDQPQAAREHLMQMLARGRDALLQPYLARVDRAGETALLYFGGRYSHAIRKGPLLAANASATPLRLPLEDLTAILPRSASSTHCGH